MIILTGDELKNNKAKSMYWLLFNGIKRGNKLLQKDDGSNSVTTKQMTITKIFRWIEKHLVYPMLMYASDIF